jgi:hypothetical protein
MRLTDYISMFALPGGIPATRPSAGVQTAAQRTSDLGLMMAATSAAGYETYAENIRALIISSVGTDGRIPGYLNITDNTPATAGLYKLYAHLWALLGMSCTQGGLTLSLRQGLIGLVTGGVIIFNHSVEWGEFKFGDGTTYGEDLDTAYVLRETALAGLALHNEAIRTQDATLLDVAWRVALNMVAVFRSNANPNTFATAVARHQASTAPDAEAYALAGLLALRFSMHEVVDVLLSELERCAVSQVTDQGLGTGYAHVNAPVVSIRSSALASAFYYAAMETGMGRGAITGLRPYRLLNGPSARLLMDMEGVDVAGTLAADVAPLPQFLNTWADPSSTIGVSDYSDSSAVLT